MFKEGDRIKILVSCSGTKVGEVYVLGHETSDGDHSEELCAGNCTCENYWELLPQRNKEQLNSYYKSL